MRRPENHPLLALGALILVVALTPSCSGSAEPPAATPPAPTEPLGVARSDQDPPVKPALQYPSTQAGGTVDVLHGVPVADPYRWLEDEKAPAVQEWVTAQSDLARAELAKLPERDALASRFRELLYLDILSAPTKRGDRTFWTRRHADKEKGIVYWSEAPRGVRTKGAASGERGQAKVLLDPNGWSTDGSTSLGVYAPSWDGKKVAYTVKKNNSDEATLYVIDVATGARSEVDVIEGAKYASPSWTPRSDGFYYTWLPTDKAVPIPDRPGFAEVRFHRLGKDPKLDPMVHPKTGDPTKFVSAEVAKDGSLLVVTIWNGWASSDVYVQDLRGGGGALLGTARAGAFVPVAVGKKQTYEVTPHAGTLWVKTDEGGSRGRLFAVDANKLDRAAWKEIIPEHPTATLSSFQLVGDKLAIHWLEKAASRLEVRALDGKPAYDVKLPGIVTLGALTGQPGDDEVYFAVESFTLPTEIHRLDVKTGKTEKSSGIQAPIDPTKYVVEQLTYPSKDGTKVTMFVVRGKNQPKNGDARTMIYGYGGFQGVESPFFAPSIYPWLERGGIYVVTNLRGGAEYGEQWHEDGMLAKKQNVFDDFIGAAEFLVKDGWTRPSRIAITGGSNGGLLVGAAMTQRPDLFGAVLCGVPLLDMVRYEKFGSGRTWASEYGSAEDPALFKVLHAYSPYHHVKPGVVYPPLLLLGADSDDRVDPMHARKFAAMVQARSSGGPALLRVERNSGHGGADMRKAEVEKNADRYAFALFHTRK